VTTALPVEWYFTWRRGDAIGCAEICFPHATLQTKTGTSIGLIRIISEPEFRHTTGKANIQSVIRVSRVV
jgi:hypothetical protein